MKDLERESSVYTKIKIDLEHAKEQYKQAVVN